MSWKRILASTVSEIVALRRGERPRVGFRVMLYHSIGPRLAHDTYGFCVEPKLFERQMAALARLTDLHTTSLVDSESPSPVSVAVTFDDGYKDNLYTAAPVLLEHNIPFTVFVTSSFIRSPSQIYLSPQELKELAYLPGVTIGSHCVTHQPLTLCDDKALWLELTESRSYIEDLIGQPINAIAYPKGAVNRRVRDAAERAGYIIGGCSRFDINDARRDPLLLCRCEMWGSDSERVFRQKLYGAWDWSRWRARDPAARRRNHSQLQR